MLSSDFSGEATLNSAFSRKTKAKTQGLCGRMHIIRMWNKGMDSMQNKNPGSIKDKSVNNAKFEDRLKRKMIGLDDQAWLNSCASIPKCIQACNAQDPSSIPGSGRSPGGGHGNPLQYSCLENPVDRV